MNKYHYRSIGLTCASLAFSLFAEYFGSKETKIILNLFGLFLIIGALLDLIAAEKKS